MKSFPMHEIVPLEFILDDFKYSKKEIKGLIKVISTQPTDSVGVMLSSFYDAFVRAVRTSQPAKEILRFLTLYKNVLLANFKVGAGTEPFTIDFDGTKVTFTPESKTDFMAFNYWKNAYDSCMIMRDMDGLRFLANVPEQIFIDSNQGASTFQLAYFRLLAHFFTGGKDTADLLLAAVKATDTPQDNQVMQAFVDQVRYQELLMLQEFLIGDATAFNKRIYDALKGHQKFYGTKANANDTTGWISLPILSACVMAFDAKKFPIEVESDYIPRWLIMGEGIITGK
jgi:Immunity protein 49